MLTALRRALAALGVVAVLAAEVPAFSAASPVPQSGAGADLDTVNRNAVQPTSHRQQAIAVSAQPRNDPGPSWQPTPAKIERTDPTASAAIRSSLAPCIATLKARRATIAAQPRAPPSRA